MCLVRKINSKIKLVWYWCGNSQTMADVDIIHIHVTGRWQIGNLCYLLLTDWDLLKSLVIFICFSFPFTLACCIAEVFMSSFDKAKFSIFRFLKTFYLLRTAEVPAEKNSLTECHVRPHMSSWIPQVCIITVKWCEYLKICACCIVVSVIVEMKQIHGGTGKTEISSNHSCIEVSRY